MKKDNLVTETESVESSTNGENDTLNDKKLPYADRCTEVIKTRKTNAKSIQNGFKRFLYRFGTLLLSIAFYISTSCVDFVASIKRNPSKGAGLLIASPGVFIGFLLGYQTNTLNYYILDWAPICLFILVLIGSINIAMAMSVIGKKNIASAVLASIMTAILVAAGVVYLKEMFEGADAQGIARDFYACIISVIVSMILSVTGCVLAFIFHDREYVKDKS